MPAAKHCVSSVQPALRYCAEMCRQTSEVKHGACVYAVNGTQESSCSISVQCWCLKHEVSCLQVVSLDDDGPGSMFGHTAVPVVDSTGFITYGGQYVNDNLVDCMWYFNIHERKWHQVPLKSQIPASRFFHGAAAVPMLSTQQTSKHSMKLADNEYVTHTVVAGGSTSSPLVTCTAEAWLMSVNHFTHEQQWKKLPDMPYGFYYNQAVVYNQAVFLTGGHLCSETKGDMPHYYLNHVLRLDLRPWLDSQQPFSQEVWRKTELKS